MHVDVALLSPPYSELCYEMPPEFPVEFWRFGLRAAVPLGRGALRAAVILALRHESELPEGITCKPICWPLEADPLLPPDLLSLVQDMALRQGVSVGCILGHVLPKGLRSARMRLRRLGAGGAESLPLRRIQDAAPAERAEFAREMCAGNARILAPGADAASEEYCFLRADPPWSVRPSAARQLEVLEYLHEHGAVSRRRLLQRFGRYASSPLQALVAAGHLAFMREEAGETEEAILLPPPSPLTLNADQAAVLVDLRAALALERPSSRLLFGVTGSGKTAVYLELAKACLDCGKSVMLLAPEVALAHKLRRDASCALPDASLFFYHGYQSPARREAVFRSLAGRDKPCLVVGTRSALFLPVPRLGCIVLDEEHDASFKQDEILSYQAKELAWYRMRHKRGLLLLGSATPDMKTWHAAQNGNLPVLRLSRRVGNRPLPPVDMVDIQHAHMFAAAGGLLAPESETALRETLARGEQAVVLLNRRGYAPLMYCLDCGKTLRCPQCEIGLAYHKGREKLICHYCGYALPFPSPCRHCKGMNYLPLGEGTERLAERLGTLAGRPVLRLDRDSTRRPGQMEGILAAFARQEASILVGTQMLSKGHHFPQVTLVVAADGDLGLNLPDYRAAERTFQLLVQSAGRAGRGEKPGRVLIQTRDVRHYCWQYVRTGDYEGFYQEELERRRLRSYPPFVRLALIRISFAVDDKNGLCALGGLAAVLRGRAQALGVRMLGPAPAPLSVLRGQRRYQCLLKAEDWPSLRHVFLFAQAQKKNAALRLFLDLDPVNML
ncbi:replication restart helicase PriA [Candidatus Desulfovibrio trichonymphae]|uniref:Replication restart protein PriA n=1 Tax=Candidatus Desulfovibrio trichonymphae TaxID=1725232 RepID=A0A1J1E3P4_9BACT|nr:primosomal protein N' [Candidatus Desulfovibrio trichonymphae]BAV92056.1 primosomal protein N' [Candidatus Desulfovibrio trichonymphae]GHU94531.1 primosomal protein N' [Deltaproteobacteria bacterium]GHU98533.1 primosomal protein N' [Deltaproteobacteria bacterium]